MSSLGSRSVFLTGGTGFVGGSILSALVDSEPDIKIKLLVRKEDDAEKLQSIYPANVHCIIGTLSDLPLLTRTAATVDFAIHAAHDNIPAVCAMIDDLASTSSSARGPAAARIISITGPRSLIDLSTPLSGYADRGRRPWSDVEDAATIATLPKSRVHAELDQAIVAHGTAKDVGVVLLSPGQLVGQGKGHFKREGALAAYYTAVANRGRAFVVGDGSAAWSWVSVGDLTAAVTLVMRNALSGSRAARESVGANRDGYHFVSSGEFSLRERAEAVHERLDLGEVESISADEAKRIHPFGPIMWAADVRFRADRLASLGWEAKELNWRTLMREGRGERA